MTSPKRAHFSKAFATEKETPTPPTPEIDVIEKGSPTPQQKSRAHKVQIPVYVTSEVRKQLKMLCAETGRTQENLLKEAINDLFKKHDKPAIA